MGLSLEANATATGRLPALTRGRVLALIDAESDAPAIIAFLVDAVARGEVSAVVLLNVQPEPDPVATRGLFAREIRNRLNMVGRQRLAPVADALAGQGIDCQTRVELGEGAVNAITCAQELDCDRILVAAPKLGAMGRIWMKATGCAPSTMAGQVMALSDIPVLVVKRALQ